LAPRYGADKFYLSTFGLYEFNKYTSPLDKNTFENRAIFGGLLGYKFVHKSPFLLDLSIGTGLGKRFIRIENNFGVSDSINEEILNFPFLAYLSIGYRFNVRSKKSHTITQ